MILVPSLGNSPQVNTDFNQSPPANYQIYASLGYGNVFPYTAQIHEGAQTVIGNTVEYKGNAWVVLTNPMYPTSTRTFFAKGLGPICSSASNSRTSSSAYLISAISSDQDTVRLFPCINKPVIDSIMVNSYRYFQNKIWLPVTLFLSHPQSIKPFIYRGNTVPGESYLDKIYSVVSYFSADSLIKTDTASFSAIDGSNYVQIILDINSLNIASNFKVFFLVSDRSVVPKITRFPQSGYDNNIRFPLGYTLSPMSSGNNFVYDKYFQDNDDKWKPEGKDTIALEQDTSSALVRYIVRKNSTLHSYRRISALTAELLELFPDETEWWRIDSLNASVGDIINIYRNHKKYRVVMAEERYGNEFGLYSKTKTFRTLDSDSLFYIYKSGIGIIYEETHGEVNQVSRKKKSVLRTAVISGRSYRDTTWIVGMDDSRDITKNSLLSFSIYPNPAKEEVNLVVKSPESGKIVLEIFNILGEIVFSKNYDELAIGESHITPQISDLPSGIFLVRLKTEENTVTKKLAIVK